MIVGFKFWAYRGEFFFYQFLSQSPINCHEILQALFSIHVATTLKISFKNCVRYGLIVNLFTM